MNLYKIIIVSLIFNMINSTYFNKTEKELIHKMIEEFRHKRDNPQRATITVKPEPIERHEPALEPQQRIRTTTTIKP